MVCGHTTDTGLGVTGMHIML